MSDEKEQSKAKKELLQQKIRIFDKLAKDSLQILSIQLLVISISVSLAPVEVFGGGSSDTLSQLTELVTNQMSFYAGLFASVSILTTILCYYRAKKETQKLPNYLFMLDERLSSNTVGGPIEFNLSRDSRLKDIYDWYYEETTHLRRQPENLNHEFDAVNTEEHQIRSLLTFSIILTIASIISFLLSFFNEGIELAKFILVSYILLAFVLYQTLKIIAQYLAAIETLGKIALRLLDATISWVLDVGLPTLGKYVLQYGIILYFLMGYYVIERRPQLVPVALFIGISSVIWNSMRLLWKE